LIITFSGMDGAGKTTQINLLKEKLKNKDKKVYYMWARGGYTPGFETLKFLIRKLLGKSIPKAGHSESRKKAMSNTFISRIWLYIAIFDMIWLYGVVLRVKSSFGKVVICDRFVDDTALDFTLNFPQIDFSNMLVWKILTKIAPKPDKSFLLLLPVEISMKRSLEKDEPFPDSKETLEQRLFYYSNKTFFHEKKYIRIDGQNPLLDIEKCIHENLGIINQ